MRKKEVANDVFEYVMESELIVENIDYKAATVYLATVCNRGDIRDAKLNRVVPYRRYRHGKKPGLSNPEITRRNLSKAGKEKEKKIYLVE